MAKQSYALQRFLDYARNDRLVSSRPKRRDLSTFYYLHSKFYILTTTPPSRLWRAQYGGPRKVLRSKLFGERTNKWSKLKRFAREPFSLAKFVWTRQGEALSGGNARRCILTNLAFSILNLEFYFSCALVVI